MTDALHDLTATETVHLLRRREVSPRELVEASIARIETVDGQGGEEVTRAERARGEIHMRLMDFFGDHDLLACPAVIVPPLPVTERFPTRIEGEPLQSYTDWMSLTFVLTLSGCPVVSAPVGPTADGLPVELQLVGRPQGEFALLQAAQFLEGVTGRVSPSLA
ncbi:amidase family protein [Lutibaculum baratangense]|uniref:Amidase n=1 Tax=Lutibaculum baratangense AMV1 TaxID=631454 RepID=V4RGV9_9HYPH|nr:amidase family protein [Lutibaculum baratangense]ESR22525.1 Amidase [Lutibaculum baratangense AMV1]